MIKLYQFPISHYCEKIRWTLDYKKLDHQLVSMVPGLHINQTKKMGVKSAVPILQHNNEIVQGSTEIINYLDRQFSEHSLTPDNDEHRKEVLDWEVFLDKEVGIPVRLCVYYILLEYPAIVKPFFLHNGPWYGRLFLFFAYSKLRTKMRYFMKINDDTAKSSLVGLNLAIDKLNQHYQQNEFLVGQQFTRADLSAAALVAPLIMPDQYGLQWPKTIPDKLQKLMQTFEGRLGWVERLYKDYR